MDGTNIDTTEIDDLIDRAEDDGFLDDVADAFARTAAMGGLDADELWRLYEIGDDQRFIINISSVIDAALTRGLRAAASSGSISRRGSGLRQRVREAEAAGLITADEARAARAVAVIRNPLAHDPKGISFSLAEYLRDSQHRNEFVQGFDGCWPGLHPDDRAAETLKRPRFTIWTAAMGIVNRVAEPHGYEGASAAPSR